MICFPYYVPAMLFNDNDRNAVSTMFVMDQKQKQIILKKNKMSLRIGLLALGLAMVGICVLFGLAPFEEAFTFEDVLGLLFICVWLSALVTLGVYSLAIGSKQMIICDGGISCHSWFAKDFIPWSEVVDWGLSYCGQTRGEGNTYDLYFSKYPCPVKNDCSKKLKGKMIKVFIMGNEYDEAIKTIIPFCKERTSVEPFIGVDKFHFLF